MHTNRGTGTETNVPRTSLPCPPRYYGNSTRRWFEIVRRSTRCELPPDVLPQWRWKHRPAASEVRPPLLSPHLNVLTFFPLTGGCSEGLDAFRFFFTAPQSGTLVCVCFSSHSFWTSMDVPAGVTQEEGNTGFSIHLLSAVLALIFLARRIQPFLSLVDREVEFCVLTI